jgi:TonB family protein
VRASVDDVVSMRAASLDSRGLNAAVTGSFAVHIIVVFVLVVAPRDWFDATDEKPPMMSISLGGTPGPRTTGTAPLAGKTVEQVTTTPPRPEAPPPEPTSDLQALANKILASTKKPTDTVVARPPVTGTEPSQGNARTVTPSRTEGTGLASGGGVGGERIMGLDADFCCMAYVQEVIGRIDERWQKNFKERGASVVTFEILRDGSVTGIKLRTSSGSGLLDRAAQAAVMDVAVQRVRPLPPEYHEDRLVIHLRFPYGGA